MSNKTPTYNLKAVVRETGLKPDTLRAWERRYGVPAPQRTDSGHRLYSQYDIDTLKWLLLRQNEGMSISRAIELWRRMETGGLDPSAMAAASSIQRPVEQRGIVLPLPAAGAINAGDTLTSLRRAWIAACLAFDEYHAEQVLAQAFALFPAETVCLELIQKGLAEIGNSWYVGSVTVQQEHFASALALRRMEALLISTPAPTRPGRILVGCPPEEAHTFVPLLLSLLLRRRGWDIVYLGADVPLHSIETTLAVVHPNLVVLTAQQLYTAAGLLEMAEVLQSERIPLAFGGLIFSTTPDLHLAIPGYYLGGHIEQAVSHVEQLMAALRPQAAQRQASYAYREALDHFRTRRPLIEATVWEQMEEHMSRHHLAIANLNFSRDIAAALMLGDLNYLHPGVAWIEGLLANQYAVPNHTLHLFLRVYYNALVAHLDQRGQVVIDWMTQLLDGERPA